MLRGFVLIAALLWTLNAFVVFDSACGSPLCQYNSMRYIVGQQSRVSQTNVGDNFIVSVSHSLPPDVNTLVGMCAFAFVIDPDTGAKYNIYDIVRSDRDGLMYLDLTMTGDEIKNRRKECRLITEEPGAYMYRCIIQLEYVCWLRRETLKVLNTTANFAIPKNAMQERLTLDNPPYTQECNCVIRSDLNCSTKIYRGTECKEQITAKDVIQYGDYICLEIVGEDSITKSHLLSLKTMQMTQRINNRDQITTSILGETDARNSLNNLPEKGKLRAIFQVYSVGTLGFRAIVALEGIKKTVTVGEKKKSVDVGVKVIFKDIVHATGVGDEESLQPWYCSSAMLPESKATGVTVLLGLLFALLLML